MGKMPVRYQKQKCVSYKLQTIRRNKILSRAASLIRGSQIASRDTNHIQVMVSKRGLHKSGQQCCSVIEVITVL